VTGRPALVSLALAACSTSHELPPPPAHGAPQAARAPDPPIPSSGPIEIGAPPPSDAPGAFDFDKLAYDDQVAYMKNEVLPRMRDAFQQFDPVTYAKFTCKSCHGPDPLAHKYKMPNPDLPVLDFKAIETGKQKPKLAEFMMKTVKPTMAAILKKPVQTKDTPDGFGCLSCHTKK